MKIKTLTALTMATLWLLTACSEDNEQQPAVQGPTLELASVTRAATEPSDASGLSDIRVFMTRDAENSYYEGMYKKPDNLSEEWTSLVSVNDQDYHIYGFMPSGSATASIAYPIGKSDYKDGAVLTLDGLAPVSPYDVCVVTGVSNTAKATQGNFFFRFGGTEKISLLLDHIYARVDFTMTIGQRYSKLRTIKLKELCLETDSIISAKVTLQGNTTEADPITDCTYTAAGPAVAYPLFTDDSGDQLVTDADTKTPKTITGYFAPTLYDNITLVCTYDVYDATGTVLIGNRTARNQLKLPTEDRGRGYRHTVKLTVEPTYLYQLSDVDLNNPTVKIL